MICGKNRLFYFLPFFKVKLSFCRFLCKDAASTRSAITLDCLSNYPNPSLSLHKSARGHCKSTGLDCLCNHINAGILTWVPLRHIQGSDEKKNNILALLKELKNI